MSLCLKLTPFVLMGSAKGSDTPTFDDFKTEI
jgi:hypothetical protein